jgi:hypothetical protein
MSVNSSRSMNKDMVEGATDGTLKKRTGGQRGGVVEPTSAWLHDEAVKRGSSSGPPISPPYGEVFEGDVLHAVVRGQ